EADALMLVTAGGRVTRVAADSVPLQGRRARGRRMAELEPGDRVVEVTRAEGRGGAPARDRPASDGGDQLDLLG
nr:hypothetical protein [Actinomycetota bacterium]NIS31342.1 hypothetical protein [Actinomycetota bacterium]NIT95616.1 hypothetical protein [Actinomycetota bacterium]NIU66462.1 hypothetical protein [Actinomycetota bacterium]NIV55795.1 hypothetical protein [Actinomycetota bacterium]